MSPSHCEKSGKLQRTHSEHKEKGKKIIVLTWAFPQQLKDIQEPREEVWLILINKIANCLASWLMGKRIEAVKWMVLAKKQKAKKE